MQPNLTNQKTVRPSSYSKKLGPVNTVLVILVMLLVGLLAFVGTKYLEASSKASVSGESTTAEAEIVKSQVRKLMNIDSTEVISVLRVEDAESLKQKDALFYKDLQKGHYLVALTNAQRLIIYDRDKNKIINFSNFSVNPELHDESKIDASEKPLKVELRFSAEINEEIKTNFVNNVKKFSSNYAVTIGNSASAANKYSGITLVLLNKVSKPKLSDNLRNQIAATQGKKSLLEKLPDNEPASSADVVIIIGSAE